MKFNIIQKIKKFMNRKERFLRACIYSFYVQKARIDLDDIGFLPFLNEQHNRDWARMKANELITQFKKELNGQNIGIAKIKGYKLSAEQDVNICNALISESDLLLE